MPTEQTGVENDVCPSSTFVPGLKIKDPYCTLHNSSTLTTVKNAYSKSCDATENKTVLNLNDPKRTPLCSMRPA
jgi:hypothetical protein